MNLMIFPIILMYFAIGWLLSKGDDGFYGEAGSIAYFLFWPAILLWLIGICISSVLLFLLRKICFVIYSIHRFIKRVTDKRKRFSF